MGHIGSRKIDSNCSVRCHFWSYMARRAGVPSGEARRVILRDLKFDSNWKPKNRFTSVSVIHKSWIRLARISILIERHRIYNLWRTWENLSRLNLRPFDGATGGRTSDFVAQNCPHEAHEARIRDIHYFSNFGNGQNFLKFCSSDVKIGSTIDKFPRAG